MIRTRTVDGLETCRRGQQSRLENDNAECYIHPEDGIVITWAFRESGVAAQLNFYLDGTTQSEAVDARKKLLP
jgi:hypothetical protein